ncbi:uncharacterized protein LOC119788967 isoform X3 [Cyprinodon tularosa]|uniref:uncharacterized protein LOC119788967 isoform X3 n=1 Tax=Cyprinodon tularosa TaxID=77115 RepID=UPI0018E1FCC5|nr:uncharacterized protein LOC119788967 isoform X3 [Cyprinodon tularosa]
MTEPSGQSDPAESPPGSAADPAGILQVRPLTQPAQQVISPCRLPHSHVSGTPPHQLQSPIQFTSRLWTSPVVLGHPWLSLHNPHLNWREGRVESWSLHCLSSCLRSAHVFLLLRCRWVTSPPFFHQKKGRHPLLQFNIIFDAASVFGNRLGEPCIEPLNRIGAMLTGNELLPLPTALETRWAWLAVRAPETNQPIHLRGI